MTFLGLKSTDINTNQIAQSGFFGLGKDCVIYTNDNKKVVFNGETLTFTVSDDEYLTNSGINNGVVGKLRLGRFYNFNKDLYEWCMSEKIPIVVIYADFTTSVIS